jgi:hypothetical protein
MTAGNLARSQPTIYDAQNGAEFQRPIFLLLLSVDRIDNIDLIDGRFQGLGED